MERRLGRGLGSLLGRADGVDAGGGISTIRVEHIRPNPFQPRKTFDAAALQELAESIRAHGILQPVVVRPRDGGYELLAGERRWRAAQQAGLTAIPASIRPDTDDSQMLELALVENVQRRDLDPMEKALGYQQLIDRLGLTQDEVAARVGIERSSVANHLRLLDLPEDVQDAIRNGLITMGHAKALLGLADTAKLRTTLGRIVRESWSVRQTEDSVRATRSLLDTKTKLVVGQAANQAKAPWISELETKLRMRVGSRVRVEHASDWKGRIVLEYFDRAGLDRLIECILDEQRL